MSKAIWWIIGIIIVIGIIYYATKGGDTPVDSGDTTAPAGQGSFDTN